MGRRLLRPSRPGRASDQGREERNLAILITGCDFHTRYKQIVMAEEKTGDLLVEQKLDHVSSEAQAFYRSLAGGPGIPKP